MYNLYVCVCFAQTMGKGYCRAAHSWIIFIQVKTVNVFYLLSNRSNNSNEMEYDLRSLWLWVVHIYMKTQIRKTQTASNAISKRNQTQRRHSSESNIETFQPKISFIRYRHKPWHKPLETHNVIIWENTHRPYANFGNFSWLNWLLLS